jgi:WD40 repeat protein
MANTNNRIILIRTLLLLTFLFLITSCITKPIDKTATPSVQLEATVSALETRVADLQRALQQTATTVATDNLLPATVQPSKPTGTPPTLPVTQVTPYIGPVKISAMAYTPAGDALYLARTIDILRSQDGVDQTLYTWPEAIPDLLADFSADGSVLAARLNNGDFILVGLPQGVILRTLRMHVDFEEWPISLALSSDGSKLAVAVGENAVQIWSVNTEESMTTLSQPGSGVTYQNLSFSPDGATLLGGFLNTITRWDIATGEITTFEPGCRGDSIFDLEYSPEGKYLAIACGPFDNPVGFLILWDVMNNRPAFRKEEILQMQRVAFSPDGAWLATGGPDGTVMFWDVTGNKEPVTIQSQTTPVYDLIFSPDGNNLVYATDGGLVYINLISPPLHSK